MIEKSAITALVAALTGRDPAALTRVLASTGEAEARQLREAARAVGEGGTDGAEALEWAKRTVPGFGARIGDPTYLTLCVREPWRAKFPFLDSSLVRPCTAEPPLEACRRTDSDTLSDLAEQALTVTGLSTLELELARLEQASREAVQEVGQRMTEAPLAGTWVAEALQYWWVFRLRLHRRDLADVDPVRFHHRSTPCWAEVSSGEGPAGKADVLSGGSETSVLSSGAAVDQAEQLPLTAAVDDHGDVRWVQCPSDFPFRDGLVVRLRRPRGPRARLVGPAATFGHGFLCMALGSPS